MRQILKCMFIPFYWHNFNKNINKEYYNGNQFPLLWGILLSGYIIIRLIIGYAHANKPDKCVVKNIGEVLIAPMYTLGCNVGKDRFNIKLN